MTVVIDDDNRDKGKTFVLTEMPAAQAEKWALRIISAMARAGVELPEDVQGMAGIAAIGLHALSNINFYDVEPLLDEMWQCVQIMPDTRHPSIVRPLVDNDIEEVQTRLRLRKDVLELHLSFSTPVGPSTSETTAPAGSDNTSMSPGQSAPSSHRARRR